MTPKQAPSRRHGPSLRPIFDLIDYRLLPPDSRQITRMLVDDHTQDEIAARLDQSTAWLDAQLNAVRKALLDHALPRADELDREARAELGKLIALLDDAR